MLKKSFSKLYFENIIFIFILAVVTSLII